MLEAADVAGVTADDAAEVIVEPGAAAPTMAGDRFGVAARTDDLEIVLARQLRPPLLQSLRVAGHE